MCVIVHELTRASLLSPPPLFFFSCLRVEKFGVETDEFDDGIIIHGIAMSALQKDATVHCYDDHRVAMAFSVLAIVGSGTVIEERRCVEKTWPNWWDDLESKVGRISAGGLIHRGFYCVVLG